MSSSNAIVDLRASNRIRITRLYVPEQECVFSQNAYLLMMEFSSIMVSMKKLAASDRARILHLLCEGSSIRAVTRLTGASKNTVIKLMIDAGKACAAYHDEHVRDLKSKRVQVDEIWSFTYAKQKNVATAKAAPDGAGDTWTWTAIDADRSSSPSWFVGGRDSECAMWFMDDLARRLANRVQLTSDGHKAYLEAVEGAFGGDIDYAMLIKTLRRGAGERQGPLQPRRLHRRAKDAGRGQSRSRAYQHVLRRASEPHDPDAHAPVHPVDERLSARRSRTTRIRSRCLMTYYNFVRIHKTLRVTPAMAAGVTDRLWEVSDIVALLEAAEPKAESAGRTREKFSLAVFSALSSWRPTIMPMAGARNYAPNDGLCQCQTGR